MEEDGRARVAWTDGHDLGAQLDQLERQLGAWLGALREAHAALHGAAESPSSWHPEPVERPATRPAVTRDERLRGAPEATPRPSPPPEGSNAERPDAPPAMAEPAGQVDSDAALLESLDRDALMWVRVRLGISGKSVRELVAEYESGKRSRKE